MPDLNKALNRPCVSSLRAQRLNIRKILGSPRTDCDEKAHVEFNSPQFDLVECAVVVRRSIPEGFTRMQETNNNKQTPASQEQAGLDAPYAVLSYLPVHDLPMRRTFHRLFRLLICS